MPRALMLSFILMFLVACGDEQHIYIYLKDIPAGAARISISAELNGAPAELQNLKQYRLDAIDLTLPRGEGTLDLQVDVYGEHGCSLARSQLRLPLSPSQLHPRRLDVILRAHPEGPRCLLTLDAVGQGLLVSTPEGILCRAPGRCKAEFAQGTKVTLHSRPQLFAHWTCGPCANGQGDCPVTMERAQQLGVRMSPSWCSDGNLCLHAPLLEQKAVLGLWGRSSSDVWAVGEGGLAMHWDGLAWARVDTPTTWALRAVHGGPDSLYAAGDAGMLLRHRGVAWEVQQSGTTSRLNALRVSNTEAWAVGDLGTVLRSRDGTTWSPVGSGTTQALRTVYDSPTASASQPYIAGTGGFLARYNGASFVPLTSPSGQNLYSLWSDGSSLWAVGANRTLSRQIAGGPWMTETIPVGTDVLSGISGRLAGDIWVVGRKPTLLHFDGSTWSEPSFQGASAPLQAVWVSSDGGAWGGGDYGLLLANTGQGFAPIEHRGSLNAVWLTKPDEIWAAGDFGSISFGQRDAATGALVWSKISTPTSAGLYALWGSTSGDLWAAGDFGSMIRRDPISGAWTPWSAPTTERISALAGVDSQDLWAVGSSGGLLRFDGETWKKWRQAAALPTDALYGVWAASASSVYAVGAQGAIWHFDGRTWMAMASPVTEPLFAIWGRSDTEVRAVGGGGTILTYDGKTWTTELPPSGGMALYAVGGNAQAIWAVGDDGLVLWNSGLGWSNRQSQIATRLYAVAADQQSGSEGAWLVGEGGVILRAGPVRQVAGCLP